MPKRRIKPRRRRQTLDSQRTRFWLLTGHDFGCMMDGPDMTEDDLATAWRDLGEMVTAYHVFGRPLLFADGDSRDDRPKPG
jgi:hypothetical protein